MPEPVFRENVVVVTGGSSGIGREIAYHLSAQGALLVLAAREASLLQQVATECNRRGARAIAVPTDVGIESDCKSLIERSIAEFGRIDTLINNAGLSMHARFDELDTVEPVERLMRINFLGSVYCTHYALPHLRSSRGRLVAVCSLAGLTGVPTRTAYAASKHAMSGFFNSLRIEIASDGVSVTIAYPGFVATEIASRAIGPHGTTLGERPVRDSVVMPAEECASRIISAAAKRQRQLVMTRRGKIGLWLRLLAPGAIDRIAEKTVERGH